MSLDDRVKNLWNNNKIVFFLLLPLVLLVVFRNVLISLLVSSGNKVVDSATKKSDDLKQEATVADTKADQIIKDADKAAEDKPVVGSDWDKK